MLAEETLLIEIAPPSAVITLNRPERRNALSLQVMRDLAATLERVSGDARVRAVILRANGPVFSAGRFLFPTPHVRAMRPRSMPTKCATSFVDFSMKARLCSAMKLPSSWRAERLFQPPGFRRVSSPA